MPSNKLTVASDTPVLTVERIFVDDPTLSSVVVPLGSNAVCVSRVWFFAQLLGDLGYGRSLYARHPISRLPRPQTLVLDAGTSIVSAAQAVLGRGNDNRYDDIVVRYPDGNYGAIVVAELFAELAHNHAYVGRHDPLTGLPNRRHFLDCLREAREAIKVSSERVIAVLFVDLDDFKPINDVLGHEAGDRALTTVAERLTRFVAAQELPITVSRLGGDEFGVLVECAASADDVVDVAEKISIVLGSPFPIGNEQITMRASIGVAVADGLLTADDLLRNADLAMYTAKRQRQGGYAIYEEAMHTRASTRLQLRAQLEGALERGEFELFYQPVVDLTDGDCIAGCEALLRWIRPDAGLVNPASFIPLCERTGLIVPLGLWVLRESCRQAAAWRSLYPRHQHVKLSANLSPRQLQEENFVEEVARILGETGLPPEDLVLEITENVFINDDKTVERLTELKRLGVMLALDDFGTGFSSLGYLARLPIDVLKLDRRFVSRLGRPQDRNLMHGIVALARTLDLLTVAEGVETEAQAQELRAAGCDRAQGYFYARPLPRDEYTTILDAAGELLTLPLESERRSIPALDGPRDRVFVAEH